MNYTGSSIKQYYLAAGLFITLSMLAGLAEATTNYLNLSQTPLTIVQQGIDPNIFFLMDNSVSMQLEWLGKQVPFGFTNSSGKFVQFTFGYPQGGGGIYGSSGSSNLDDVIPGFSKNNLYGAQFRSSYLNANYYNPTVTYTPWACPAPYPESSTQSAPLQTAANNSTTCHWDTNVQLWVMPNANPDAAFLNPFYNNNSAPVRSLTVWNDDTSGNPSPSLQPGNGYIGDSGDSGLQFYVVDSSSSSGYQVLNTTSYPGGFWPAVYWNYIGPRPATSSDLKDLKDNYQRVQICPPTLTVNSNGNIGTCTGPPLISLVSSPQPYHTYRDDDDDYIYIKKDGSEVKRTYTQEIQNFANWYSFYRSRISMARAGASIAFMHLPTNFRVDFGTVSGMINGSNPTLNTTEPFSQKYNNRTYLLKRFNEATVDKTTTPLRQALQGVGEWLSKNPSSSAPWGTSSAESKANNNAAYLSCRANYTLLVSGDNWNGNSPNLSPSNADGTKGPVNTSYNGVQYQYLPVLPYKDGVGNTLADVAMYYWETDLQPSGTNHSLTNDVPVNNQDPAFWQHMVTFTLGMGEVPTLVQSYMQTHPGTTEQQAQAAVFSELQSGTVSWPTPSANAPEDADDLWHAAVDGHGGFLSAQNPQQFESALTKALTQIEARTSSGSSVATNTQKAGQVRTNTQIYQALYHPLNWWGELLAEPVLLNPTNNQPYVSSTANWDASCVLTGGACPAMGTNKQGQALYNVQVESPSNRVIITDNGSQGVPFEWSDLSAAEQTLLNGSDNLGQERLGYLRGIRSNEQSHGGLLRTRSSVLGDIVHSDPVWVGYAKQNYPTTPGQPTKWVDKLYPSTSQPENSGSQTFAQFESANWNRLNVVYDGANDGMLHGFEAGSFTYDSSTGALNFNNTDNDGKEVLAFVPQTVYQNIDNFTNPLYNHHYYVDATPGTGDVFYDGKWHTWLADGLGAGGKELFVLDINNPNNFSQTNAASLVKADWTTSNLTCVNDANCAQDLGYTFGKPQIRRFHNGDWGIIWGNGYNSTNGEAGIFIGLINPTSGAINVYWYSTGEGPSQDPTGQSRPDGIGFVNAADLDSDHIADYIYAGDLFGNVWRLNVTSNDPLNWHFTNYGSASSGSSSSPVPLFSAVNANGTPQPITTQIQVVSIPSGLPSGQPQNRLMLLFGTGTLLSKSDATPNLTASGVQSLYGIWDWKLANWNTISSRLYANLTTVPTINRSDLLQQTITSEQFTTNSSGVQVGLRTTSQNPVQWADLTYNGTQGTEYGWYLDLVSPVYGNQGEMVIYSPDVQNGVFVVNTTILGQQSLTCGVNDNGGWTMALDPADGAQLQFNAFAINNISDYNGSFSASTLQGTYAGITVGAVGSPAYLSYGGKTYLVVSTSSGKTKLVQTGLGVSQYNSRISWRELR